MDPDVLSMWVIYWNPTDYPGKFVAREWQVHPGKLDPVPMPNAIIVDSLEAARTAVQFASSTLLTRLAPAPGDDAKILETWL